MAPMEAELLTVGTELISGATVNTNAAYLARQLAALGIPCRRQAAVGDTPDTIAGAIQDALRYADLLLITGGLGPTFDDLTREALPQAVNRPLRMQPAVAATIRRFYVRHHRTLQSAALRQASLPEGGGALPNPIGTAPGVWLELPHQVIVALPGVPGEMRAIMEQHVVPRLKNIPGRPAVSSRTLRTAGIVELQIEEILRTLSIPKTVQLGLYPHLRMVDVRMTATASTEREAVRAVSRVEAQLRRRLGRAVYGSDGETLEGTAGAWLVRRHLTLAVAESCTGGLLTDQLTNVSGSSRYLRGALVAYHNDLKRGCLNVPAPTLARFGAVSAPVARAMAEGIRRLAGADVGLSVTGIAGPTGATKRKPMGLVYLGLADRRGTRTLRCQFFGDRTAIKLQAAQTALNWLRLSLIPR